MERTGITMPRGSRAPFTERGVLRIFVRRDHVFSDWRDSVAALASRAAPRSSISANYHLRGANVGEFHFAGRPFGASFLLHFFFVALVLYLPWATSAKTSARLTRPSDGEKIYYWVPPLDSPKLPRLAPAGPGGRPGSGSEPTRVPALGSVAPHPNINIVSKPIHADNLRQTIYQSSAPPDLKIAAEQKLPNIVLVHAQDALKAPLDLSLAKPTQANPQVAAMAAPSVNTNPANSLTTLLTPSKDQPRLPIPALGGGAPIQRFRDASESVAGGTSGDAPDLLVLGVDPADSMTKFSVPGGNRWGEFSIAPPTGTPGSPGGDPGGAVGGGNEGGKLGGDGSAGIGPGRSGGGGTSGTPVLVSIAGPGGGSASPGLLDSAFPASMVYAVAAPALNVRKNALVIFAGPMGGGGLNVYGALKCGKIYTIFLPMPGKNWSLQYCDKSASTQKVASEGGTTVVHLDTPLLPPDFDVAQRFNFKRIPVPVEKTHRSIILKGTIAIDGTVQNLVVYQGVIPVMDEAARIAFSRWHFKPAMKNGKPVEVEILVGIPPLAEEDRVNR